MPKPTQPSTDTRPNGPPQGSAVPKPTRSVSRQEVEEMLKSGVKLEFQGVYLDGKRVGGDASASPAPDAKE